MKETVNIGLPALMKLLLSYSPLAALILGAWCCGTTAAVAAEVTMTGDVLPPAALGSTILSGSGTTNNPYVYSFQTGNGLDMDGWKIYGNNQNNKNTTLNLNGGSIVGTRSATAFDFKTLRATGVQAYSGHLTITNVGDIRIGKLWTYVVQNYGYGGQASYAGNVTIGANATGQRAGKVEIAEILTHATEAYDNLNAGAVTVDSTNDVLIWDGATAGNIDASFYNGYQCAGNSGEITVRHQGSFLANNVLSRFAGTQGSIVIKPILLDGNVLGTGPSGTCWANTLSAASESNGTYGVDGGIVTVRGYAGLTVANGINAHSCGAYSYGPGGGSIFVSNITGIVSIGGGGLTAYTYAGQWGSGAGSITFTNIGGSISVGGPIHAYAGNSSGGGHVSLSCAGNITIGGEINLNATSASGKGVLFLNATGVNTAITLASLNMTNIRHAVIALGGRCVIKGDLVGFNTNTAAQTELRLPAGRRMYYYPDLTNNAYLARGKYLLADVNGVPAAGGTLMPYASPGTVITVR